MLARPFTYLEIKMLVKNISARLHHIGDVSIIPGAQAEVGDMWRGSLNPAELVVIEAAPVAPVAPVAAPKVVAPPPGSKAAQKLLSEEKAAQ